MSHTTVKSFDTIQTKRDLLFEVIWFLESTSVNLRRPDLMIINSKIFIAIFGVNENMVGDHEPRVVYNL